MNSSTGPNSAVMVVETWGEGGTETYVLGLIDYLKKNSYDVDLVLLRQPNEKSNTSLAMPHTVTGFYGLVRFLYRNRYDFVHLHLYTSLLPVVLISKIIRVPVVVTLHIKLFAWGIKGRILWRMACALANVVVAVSRISPDELHGKNIYPLPISGGANNEFFFCKRILKDKDFNIVAIGRLEYQKNWEVLIQALRNLPYQQNKNIILNFYGNGSLQTDLENLAEKLGVNVIFHGCVEREKLIDALSYSNLSVLPSRFEGLPLSAMEGMAAGVPTIVSNFNSSTDLIEHKKTGHIFPVGNVDSLRDLIDWHMENPDDSEVIGKMGRDFIKDHYSEDRVYEPYLEIYKNVCC